MSRKGPIDFHKRQQQPSMHEIAGRVATGQLAPHDRFNREIKRGDFVTYRPEVDLVFQVIDVSSLLDPRNPGLLRLTLSATIPLRVGMQGPIAVLTLHPHLRALAEQQGEVLPAGDAPDVPAAAADAAARNATADAATDDTEATASTPQTPDASASEPPVDEAPPPTDADEPPQDRSSIIVTDAD